MISLLCCHNIVAAFYATGSVRNGIFITATCLCQNPEYECSEISIWKIRWHAYKYNACGTVFIYHIYNTKHVQNMRKDVLLVYSVLLTATGIHVYMTCCSQLLVYMCIFRAAYSYWYTCLFYVMLITTGIYVYIPWCLQLLVYMFILRDAYSYWYTCLYSVMLTATGIHVYIPLCLQLLVYLFMCWFPLLLFCALSTQLW